MPRNLDSRILTQIAPSQQALVRYYANWAYVKEKTKFTDARNQIPSSIKEDLRIYFYFYRPADQANYLSTMKLDSMRIRHLMLLRRLCANWSFCYLCIPSFHDSLVSYVIICQNMTLYVIWQIKSCVTK